MKKKGLPIDKLSDGIEIKFTVDAALLSELGERLVGKPYVALSELIKNSYDADANNVFIRFDTDLIEIVDDGHGMDFKAFQSFWMRVGSQHKQKERYSKEFNRPMTGSKGVGRLAAQFLAKEIWMQTISKVDPKSEIQAFIDWSLAHHAGELTEATANYKVLPPTSSFPNKSKHGTRIILRGLNQNWDSDEITSLAKEIWPLQPPFSTANGGEHSKEVFNIRIEARDSSSIEKFEKQMQAVLSIWDAKITGKLTTYSSDKKSKVDITVEFNGEEKIHHSYNLPVCNLNSLNFEIRIFKLQGKQRLGIIVEEAREYFKQFGGIHVYDAGFRMPFYGTPEGDWLRIQYDQASRVSNSALLPAELQVPRGLTFLPTLSRTFGVVHVDTAMERKMAYQNRVEENGDYLKIQVTRDRLVDNKTSEQLRDIVRYAVDFYATREAARQYNSKELLSPTESLSKKVERVEDIIEHYKDKIPKEIYKPLISDVRDVVQASQVEQERLVRQTGLLGALATTGVSALAYEHETRKYHFELNEVINNLEKIKVADPTTQKQLEGIAKRLRTVVDQSKALRGVFVAMLDEENRTLVSRFKARNLLLDVSDQLGILLHGIRPSTYEIDDSLLLPKAGYAEWSAVFQNILLNAVNATLDKEDRRISISSHSHGDRKTLLIQDTGTGVDLSTSQELFKPFVRKQKISPDRKGLGVGGTGLGLTIVKMICDSIGCDVSFTKPDRDYKTAFQIQWREKK